MSCDPSSETAKIKLNEFYKKRDNLKNTAQERESVINIYNIDK